eukprot:TRINITY_DN8873_c0_g1_i2.p1 TRINITY_DN8873_c0_g1~~TRINITY_DN8873_c0_g1_i2.p1  ORF type:complete len:766 (+),score=156.61 TRINITY_DN8873_c0_g1_i2:166-2298(+)
MTFPKLFQLHFMNEIEELLLHLPGRAATFTGLSRAWKFKFAVPFPLNKRRLKRLIERIAKNSHVFMKGNNFVLRRPSKMSGLSRQYQKGNQCKEEFEVSSSKVSSRVDDFLDNLKLVLLRQPCQQLLVSQIDQAWRIAFREPCPSFVLSTDVRKLVTRFGGASRGIYVEGLRRICLKGRIDEAACLRSRRVFLKKIQALLKEAQKSVTLHDLVHRWELNFSPKILLQDNQVRMIIDELGQEYQISYSLTQLGRIDRIVYVQNDVGATLGKKSPIQGQHHENDDLKSNQMDEVEKSYELDDLERVCLDEDGQFLNNDRVGKEHEVGHDLLENKLDCIFAHDGAQNEHRSYLPYATRELQTEGNAKTGCSPFEGKLNSSKQSELEEMQVEPFASIEAQQNDSKAEASQMVSENQSDVVQEHTRLRILSQHDREQWSADNSEGPVVRVDLESFLGKLPSRYANRLRQINHTDSTFFNTKLREVSLKAGDAPRYFADGAWRNLFEEFVDEKDIQEMRDKLQGKIGQDGCVALDNELHVVTCTKCPQGNIDSFNLKVGRCVYGCARALHDLLFESESSILVVGPPFSGKTILLREIARVLSEFGRNVIVMDTFNRIGGNGDVPHDSLGYARRMMVPNFQMQSSMILECLCNFSPDVIVIDHFSAEEDAPAVELCKQSGVRMIASAVDNEVLVLPHSKLNDLFDSVVQIHMVYNTC